MKPLNSPSLAWFSLVTAFLFSYDATFALSNVAQLCAKWKSDANQRFLAMGTISEAGGESRFYAVSSEFEGISVPADNLQVPTKGAGILPSLNFTDAAVLDLSSSKASWPQGSANGKGAFILSFRPESGFNAGEKFLAIFSSDLVLASLTNPQAQVKKVPVGHGPPLPPGAVFSTDNKLTSETSVIASLRYVNHEETGTLDAYLRRNHDDSISIQQLRHQLPAQVKPSLAIDGGFLFNSNQALIAFSNRERKIYVFHGGDEHPVEVAFTDFFNCPNGYFSNSLKAAGVVVPVIGAIVAVFFFMSAKKKKQGAGAAKSAIGSTSSVSGSSGGSKSRAPVKSQTSNKKPGTPK